MLGDPALPGPNDPLRATCACSDFCALGPNRRGLLGRLDDALDYTMPVLFGVAAHLAACRMTWLLRVVKPTNDLRKHTEPDPIG